MQIIPLAAVPSQNLTTVLGGQQVQLSLYQLGAQAAIALFIDLVSNGAVIFSARECRAYGALPDTVARFMLVGRHYLGFAGDLLFLDTQATLLNPTQDPQYQGLGTRWQLMYFTPADLQAAGLIE